MAIVTGFMRDFELGTAPTPLSAFGPEVILVPSGATISSAVIHAPREIVIPTSVTDGSWTEDLIVTTTTATPSWLEVRLRWRNPDMFGPGNGFVEMRFPGWRLHVPPGGGAFHELVDTGDGTVNPLMIFWQPTEPDPFPMRAFWGNTLTGLISQKVGETNG